MPGCFRKSFKLNCVVACQAICNVSVADVNVDNHIESLVIVARRLSSRDVFYLSVVIPGQFGAFDIVNICCCKMSKLVTTGNE